MAALHNGNPPPFPTAITPEAWAQATLEDDYAEVIRREIQLAGEAQHGRFRRFSGHPMHADVLCYEGTRLYVPASLRSAVLTQRHDLLPSRAHGGVDATYAKLLRQFYWPTMRRDIRSYIRTCRKCRDFAPKEKHGFMRGLPIPGGVNMIHGFNLFFLPDSEAT